MIIRLDSKYLEEMAMKKVREEGKVYTHAYKEEKKRIRKENSKELSRNPIRITRYRNDRHLMSFPCCSVSKRKRLKSIDYVSSDGRLRLQVSANHEYGMVKVWDLDILIFALSKAGEIARNKDCCFPSSVEFSMYECLSEIKSDPGNGQHIKWFKEALKRLAGTLYITNIFGESDNTEEGFNLVTYRRVEDREKPGLHKIRLTFSNQILESVRKNNGLLSVDRKLIKEESGIKKRLLQIVGTYKNDKSRWEVGLARLKELCAHEGALKHFKYELKKYSLPWKLSFEKAIDGSEKVVFE